MLNCKLGYVAVLRGFPDFKFNHGDVMGDQCKATQSTKLAETCDKSSPFLMQPANKAGYRAAGEIVYQ